MKRCPRCNLNFPDSLAFCESCGGGLGEAVTLRCPGCGETAQPGWKFCVKCRTQLPSSGIGDLSNPTEKSELPPTLPLVTPEASSTALLREEETTRSSQQTISDTQIRVRCRSCRNLVDEDATFCEYCGANMFEDTAPLIVPLPPRPSTQRFGGEQTYGRDTLYEPGNVGTAAAVKRAPAAPDTSSAADEKTAERTVATPTMFESYGQSSPAPQFKWWHGLLVVIVVLMVIAGLGGGGWYWWSQRSSTAETSAQPGSNQAPSQTSSSTSSSSNTQEQTNAAQLADDELKQLRAWRVSAQPSEGNKIVTAIEDAEKKYPTDYRFPYERAKLSIKGMISHHEAFEAIFLAGEKAIDNGKAQEMLSDLMSDKDGDFYKMSRGHREWAMLGEALRNEDKSALETHDE